MIDWVNLSSYIVFAIIVTALVFDNLRLRASRRSVKTKLNQAFIDQLVYVQKISELSQQQDSQKIEQTEGFLNFVTQSRDWAFQYIEDVQSALNKFVEKVGPKMTYYDKYGRIAETVHASSMEIILEAYNELIEILPENENKQQGE